jgi:hypothetical protein
MAKPQQPVKEGSIASRLHITSAAIHEALRLQARFGRGITTLREDDQLSA